MVGSSSGGTHKYISLSFSLSLSLALFRSLSLVLSHSRSRSLRSRFLPTSFSRSPFSPVVLVSVSRSLILSLMRFHVLAIHGFLCPCVCECICVSVYRSIGSTTAIFILIETAATEIIGDNDICDCVEHELNVGCISGASRVAVDLLIACLVIRLELRLDVRGGLAVFLRSSILGEADGEGGLANFLLEEIFLVQEKNDRRVGEPFVIANRVEQLQAFLHSIRRLIFV